MTFVEPTFRRSLSIWWSIAWRGIVLYMPAWVIIFPLVFALMPEPSPDGSMTVEEAKRVAYVLPFVWIFAVGGMIVAQTFAVRWMLKKQRWTDFFVALVPADDPRVVMQKSDGKTSQ